MDFFLLDVIEFKVNREIRDLKDDSKLTIEREIRFRTNQYLDANTTIKWIVFEDGSIDIYLALVTTVTTLFAAYDIISNYEAFKKGLKELIKDIGIFLNAFFKVETEISSNERAIDKIGNRYLVEENGHYYKISSTKQIENGITRNIYVSSTEVY